MIISNRNNYSKSSTFGNRDDEEDDTTLEHGYSVYMLNHTVMP